MTIPTQFPEWLSVALRDGLGGLPFEPPAIVPGQPRSFRFWFDEHPTFGNWTDGTFGAQLRAAPGAATALATYACTTGTPASGKTPVDFVLSVAAQSGLPAVNPTTGLAELLLDISYTIGGVEYSQIVTRQLIRGAV